MAVRVPALEVRQWLPDWDGPFAAFDLGPVPPKHFYMTSLNASTLRRLSATHRRGGDDTAKRSRHRVDEEAIQRRHDAQRSAEIRAFVRHGFPWSKLSETKRRSGKYDDLQKPGWLPTAIIVNALKPEDVRRGSLKVAEKDLIKIEPGASPGIIDVVLPKGAESYDWKPKGDLRPLEVIDGQHRLWAFTEKDVEENYQLPVVVFHGLARAWQAYLFWVINIKPKRISSSLAFDLYPLLRAEPWLDRSGDLEEYRLARAQEIVESMWSNPASPLYHRINMLGESGTGRQMVTQAAWIRALVATLLRSNKATAKSHRRPPLFGAPVRDESVLPWTRAQEAAFVITALTHLRDAIGQVKDRNSWAEQIRMNKKDRGNTENDDPAFYGPATLLNRDQGAHAFLMVLNDVSYSGAEDVGLFDWQSDQEDASDTHQHAVTEMLASIHGNSIDKYLAGVGKGLAGFDWRSASADSASPLLQDERAALKGTTGYLILRRMLLEQLAKQNDLAGRHAKTFLR